MYCSIQSAAVVGVHAVPVQVEVDVSAGLPMMSMVGSLGSEVREAKERVLSALKNIGLEMMPMHITVNLSPADLRKEGTAYDVPIAVGMLTAMGHFAADAAEQMLFLGELGLNGEIRTVRGVLPAVCMAKENGMKACFVPMENVKEGAVIDGIDVYGVENITELFVYLQADKEDRENILTPYREDVKALFEQKGKGIRENFSQVSGQETAKRAALIAAAGFHNLLMLGPPGAGKSMIAKRIPGILPPLSLQESLEVSSVYSVAGLMKQKMLFVERPFQSPHHTISTTALTGGGSRPRPGMISLAHRGVLFLDELPEFQKSALEAMRQPLESRMIQVARTAGIVEYPADFMLVCAMNPCPCGYYPDRNRCKCTEPQIRKYLGKISGPILDRVDLCVELKEVDVTSLQESGEGGISSEMLQQRVEAARKRQEERFRGTEYRFNGDIQAKDMEHFCRLGDSPKRCMKEMYQKLKLSARSYHRILKVARTIADLGDKEEIQEEHLLEACCYRPGEAFF